jgi:Domain of unknown function (DUF4160)
MAIAPRVLLAHFSGLDFVMVWMSRRVPVVHVDRGFRWGIVDVRSARMTHGCLSQRDASVAEKWVGAFRRALLERWAEIGLEKKESVRRRNLPQIARLEGLKIEMYWRDHARPHIHVKHSGEYAVVDISSRRVIEGRLTRTQRRVLVEWMKHHTIELQDNWNRAAVGVSVVPIRERP